MRHLFSYKRYGNCLLFLLYLYFTRRIYAIYVRKSVRNWGLLQFHFVGLSRRNNIIHLTQNYEQKKRDYSPVFVYGRPEVFDRKLMKEHKYWILLGYDMHCERHMV